MIGGEIISLWSVGLTLVLLCGLNPLLGVLALSVGATSLGIAAGNEMAWVADPRLLWLWLTLLALQFLADLYFVPTIVRDRAYLHPARYMNAYLHTRLQSFFRPLAGAVVLAALPLPLSADIAAVAGFVGGTLIYWSSAWVREHIAASRGSVVLLLVETAKNVAGLGAAVLLGYFAPLALGLLVSLLLPVAVWTARLRREQQLYPIYGGRVASEDS